MPLRLILFISVLAPYVGAVETAVPSGAGAQALSLPAASASFTRNFSGLTGWIGIAENLRLSVGIDSELTLLSRMTPEAQSAALAPVEAGLRPEAAARLSNWEQLNVIDRAALLRELSIQRRLSAPGAAASLRGRIKRARESGAGPVELSRLRQEAEGFRIFGGDGEAALGELDSLVYERRLSPALSQARGFANARLPEDLPLGADSAGAAALERSDARTDAARTTPEPPAPKRPDLAVRALTAALLVPSIVGLIHLGGAAFVGFTTLLAGLSLQEYATMLQKGGRPVQPVIAIGSAVALALAVALHGPLAPVIAGVTMLAAARELLRPDHSFERAAHTVFGALLFGFLPAHLALVRGLSPYGERIALMLFASAWMTDTTAYFFGRRWGHRKIAPHISPNKTWEGAAAGFIGGMAAVLGIWATSPLMMPLWAALAVGLVMGAAGQASGYINSMIKRANGVKDSGNLLPGHGGVIDRFDTFVLSAALVYYLLSII